MGAYLHDIESVTGRQIGQAQRAELDKAMDGGGYARLSPGETESARRDFNNARKELISDWETHTGQRWPTYQTDVLSRDGAVVRRAGSRYDAHHIIELCFGGPNAWWNLHPAAYPDEHQGGIHRQGGPASTIFGGDT